ncbi:MAG TPA: glycosyltransferase [Gammaproteobacteria bacterium]|nr:glycosyltransferase [Gammaproteobacteria bacterium]
MSPARFSVIIPAWNSANTLARAIDSVLGQTEPAYEILIVDDASPDDTAGVVERYGERVRYLRRERNAGVSAARNFGAEQARGDWLAFLDADDWYYPRRIAAHAAWLREDPTLDFLTGDYEYRDADDRLLGSSLAQHEAGRRLIARARGGERVVMEAEDFESFVADHFGDTHTLSVPRATFLALGGYPLGFKVCEDVHFLTRLVACSRRIGVICSPLAVYSIHGGSATRRDPVHAQRENVRTLCDLRRLARGFPDPVRRGVMTRMRLGRLNLGYALCRQGTRAAALRAVLPSLLENPGLASLRDIMSIARG